MLRFPCLVKLVIQALFAATQRQLAPAAEVPFQKNTWTVSVRQSNETKPSTKLILVRQESLLYLEFNKPNKANVPEINLFKIQLQPVSK